MAWKKGESGNPNGRPQKNRTLTAILERTGGSKKVYSDLAPKRLVAELLWQAASTGEVTFPGQDDATQLDIEDWIGVVKFIYQHIDGPPKAELQHSGPDGGPIVTATTTLAEWDAKQEAARKQVKEALEAFNDDAENEAGAIPN